MKPLHKDQENLKILDKSKIESKDIKTDEIELKENNCRQNQINILSNANKI